MGHWDLVTEPKHKGSVEGLHTSMDPVKSKRRIGVPSTRVEEVQYSESTIGSKDMLNYQDHG